MKKLIILTYILLGVFIGFYATEIALAIGGINGGNLEGKVNNLTNKIITVILPAVSILGLVWSAVLASMGDSASKGRMILIFFASIVGFLAPIIIKWLQLVSGAGSF